MTRRELTRLLNACLTAHATWLSDQFSGVGSDSQAKRTAYLNAQKGMG